MADDTHSEQRQAPRIARGFMVRYRPAENAAALWSVSPLRDLSRTGARFLAESAFPVRTVLELQLVLPMTKQPVAIRGRVAWLKPGPLSLMEHGVAFETIGPETQQAVDAAVAHFLKRQRVA